MTSKPIKPRKTPVQARSAETVRIILEAAAHILERHGLEAYSTNAVAERAGREHRLALPVFSGQGFAYRGTR